jgi:hypothetical protein
VDFMKWLNSLDELLYEVMSWLVFWPVTLWRTLRHPLGMMDYADRQLMLPEDKQYGDAVSPPLFLALCLLLAHGVSIALGQDDRLIRDQHGLSAMITDQTSALLVRIVIFAAFPLLMAVRLIRLKRMRLDRETMRQPFYAQCYLAAVFALGLTLVAALSQLPGHAAHVAAALLLLATLLGYWAVEARWFAASAAIGLLRAAWSALAVLLQGFALLLFVGLLLR